MEKQIVLFDGVCNLCNKAVTFIIERDKKNVFNFGALQNEKGKALLNKYDIDPEETDSIILIKNDKAYIKSTAALHIAKNLSGGWPLLYTFIILPKFIRDSIYDWVARNRYGWFGKKDNCMIPNADLRSKFIDN
ncbi:thiol-disulfide oxidoreductase DCC family protein [Nonlabens ponticola]|uniref:Thiol-disulfide oxidoreductase DCC family protein n=1 Tax=Nonlabens ponticola TaxID=2496866 RepID=A0A3S9MZ81_9FLAO|nr:thiol-disulfide oxidoreductase DCC family protein [Nonlabens ponticola]AZQ44402.1 thiol-disulfide oxidoreductase DCC family protein [Nonlabens ponticola]